MDLPTAIALFIVALSAAYLAYRWSRSWFGSSTRTSCGCGTCPASVTAGDDLPENGPDHSR
jgi:hypothetical protein